VMLLAGGSDALTGLQNITIAAALPFVLVMVGLAISLTRDLRHDPLMLRTERGEEIVEQAVIEGVTTHGDDFSLVVSGDESAAENGRTQGGRLSHEAGVGSSG
jgi:choline-glycine betaine transporter